MRPTAPLGIVAGSGIELESLLDSVTRARGFDEIPGLSLTSVSGHSGRIVEGLCGNQAIVLQQGRHHFYEGHSYERVTQCVDLMHELGVTTVLYTNAAGALTKEMTPGDLMAVSEMSLFPFGRWCEMPKAIAPDFVLNRCDRQGVYMWVHGPCYETPAEIAALQALKCDAVGMSTAPEVARCHQMGLKAGAVSCITNNCTSPVALKHEDVVRTARSASAKLRAVIRAWLRPE